MMRRLVVPLVTPMVRVLQVMSWVMMLLVVPMVRVLQVMEEEEEEERLPRSHVR